jgi:hypothetical protein
MFNHSGSPSRTIVLNSGRTSRPARPPIPTRRLAVAHGQTSVIQDPNQHHRATEGQPTHSEDFAGVASR